MEKPKIRQFTEFFDTCITDRVDELYGELEKLEEFKNLSAIEDKLYKQMLEDIPAELQQTYQDYTNVVEQKYLNYQTFYYKVGFWDFSKVEKQASSCTALSEEYIRERVSLHFDTLQNEVKFKDLSAEEEALFNALKSSILDTLLQALLELSGLVQSKCNQYKHFYYRMGFMDCAQFIAVYHDTAAGT